MGEALNGAQVLPLVSSTRPDVVLLDLRMPQADGIVCLEQLRRRFPDVRVILFSAFLTEGVVARAQELGADGIVDKCLPPDELVDVIRRVAAGETIVDGEPEEQSDDAGLSQREVTVLAAAARGLSNRQIARELWLSEQTIKFHLGNVYRKLDARNRTEAVHIAYRIGIVESPVFD